MERYLDGLRFGMLLQLAIGPICLLVFNTAKNTDFINALYLIGAVALADALYIYLAMIGASKLLAHESIRNVVRMIGALILCLFGMNMILSTIGNDMIPTIALDNDARTIFVQGLILTLSNPLTIVFWGTILTKKMLEEKLERTELIVFSAGLVSATIFFLTGVAVLGTGIKDFLSTDISNGMNIVVGAVIVCFGVKMFLDRQKGKSF